MEENTEEKEETKVVEEKGLEGQIEETKEQQFIDFISQPNVENVKVVLDKVEDFPELDFSEEKPRSSSWAISDNLDGREFRKTENAPQYTIGKQTQYQTSKSIEPALIPLKKPEPIEVNFTELRRVNLTNPFASQSFNSSQGELYPERIRGERRRDKKKEKEDERDYLTGMNP
jgi:hypothetical protein